MPGRYVAARWPDESWGRGTVAFRVRWGRLDEHDHVGLAPAEDDPPGAVRVGAAARHLHPQLVVVSGVDRRAVVRVPPGRHPFPRTAGLLADRTGPVTR